MTNVCVHQMPFSLELRPECFPWLHSVTEELAFTSPWVALQRAEDLASEVGYTSAIRIDMCQLSKPKRIAAKLSFDPVIQVRILDDDTCLERTQEVFEDVLSGWPSKPWSLADPRTFSQDFCIDIAECSDQLSALQVSVPFSSHYAWMHVPRHPAKDSRHGLFESVPPDAPQHGLFDRVGTVQSDHDACLCPSFISLPRSGPMQNRPDLTENPNFPDPSSSSDDAHGHAGQGRRPLRHFPAWVEELWNILQDEGAAELLEEGPVIYLSTYYLSHRNCVRQADSRPIRLTRRYENWSEEIKRVWGDHFDRFADFSLFLVKPEPPISITRGIVGIALVVQHAQPERAAILTTALFDELPTPRTREIAHVLDIWTDRNTVLHRAEAFEVCEEAQRQGLRPCVLRAGGYVFPRERPIRAVDGLGIVVSVPMLLDEDTWNTFVRPRMETWPEFAPLPPADNHGDDDQVVLMARRPRLRAPSSSGSSSSSTGATTSTGSDVSSTRSVTRPRTVLFCFDGISFSRHIIDVPGPGQVHEIETALSLPQGTVSMAVGVSARPEDFVAMELLCILVVQAHQPRPIAFLRLALLDLEIIEPNDILPGVFQRTVKWLPHTTTRLSLFRVLGLEPLLTLHEEKTHLWLNNELVDPMSRSALTIEDGDYVKIFIGDDEFRFQCDAAPEEMALMQITTNHIPAVEKLGLPAPATATQIADENERPGSLFGLGLDDEVVGHPAVISCSFTDEFLRAVDALRTATEATPEFPEDDPGDLSAYDFWVQRLHEAWTQFATVGPGGMERLGRIETWFNDHTNFQRCHHTRIAVLGPDAHRWEEQLRHLWWQYILPGAPLEFYMVEPTPEDASGQIIGQLILVQRPHHLQRSVVISTYDTEYDQGRAHSLAVVMGDHVDLHSVCTMLQAHDDCPPERPENACSLWEGPRMVEPSERVYARHGSVFKFANRLCTGLVARSGGMPSGTRGFSSTKSNGSCA